MGFLDDYQPVEDRLREFYERHPYGRINTELLVHGDGHYIVKATIYLGDEVGSTPPKATGLAHDSTDSLPANMKASALEVCETSAIGRALANMGLAPKGARPSREEMQKASPVPHASPAARSAATAENAPQRGATGASAAPDLEPVTRPDSLGESGAAATSEGPTGGTTGQHDRPASLGATSEGVGAPSPSGLRPREGGTPGASRPTPSPKGIGAPSDDPSEAVSGGEYGEGSTPAPASDVIDTTNLIALLEAVGGSETKAINAVNKAMHTAYKRAALQTLEPEDWAAGLQLVRGNR